MLSSILKSAAVALVLAAGLAGQAGAATINEGDLKGGAFSKHWKSPTYLGEEIDGVSGTGRSGDFDMFVFTGLPDGAQTVTFDFAGPGKMKDSYSAGGELLWSTGPFEHAWDGVRGGKFDLKPKSPTDLLTIVLGDDFSGDLYIGLYFTYGRDISYSVSTDAGGMPPAVPLPGAGAMLLTALAGAAAVGVRRRRN